MTDKTDDPTTHLLTIADGWDGRDVAEGGGDEEAQGYWPAFGICLFRVWMVRPITDWRKRP